jgi:hypothetical protein
MARRPPGSIRANDPRGRHDPGIDGLSARGRTLLAQLERARLWPGAAGEALEALTRFVHDPMYRLWDPSSGCGQPLCCPDPVELRRTLAIVVHNLPRADARKLRARIAELDDEW